MSNQFSEVIRKYYRSIAVRFKIKKNPVVGDALWELYPQKDQRRLYEDHQIKKFGVMSGIIFIGIVSVVCLRLCSQTEDRLTEGAQLIRNEWGAGNYTVTLQAENADNGWQKDISLQVDERQLTDAEREVMFDEVQSILPELIKGENTDLQHVESDLELMTELTGYPVIISWSSSSNRIDMAGAVERTGLPDEGEQAELTARIVYESEKRTFSYPVYLLAEQVSEEEGFFRELEDILQKDEEEKISESILKLPEEINGQKILWQEKKEGNTLVILLLAVVGALAAAKGVDHDLEKCCMARNKQLVAEYPHFLSKLRLYLSAGMTTKAAFYRLAEDYKSRLPKNNYLYEELQLACNRFQNGISEEQVYREWGKRCKDMRYRRLSLLLCSHLRLGNGQLLRELTEEEEGAREERRRHARKLGEEATVKLLFPMLLQLLVVLCLVLVPAYMDFGGI